MNPAAANGGLASSPPKLLVRGLSKTYGPLTAVSDVGFEIGPGEVFGLLGPNGAGKTTTVECLIGLIRPDRGSIEIGGVDARKRPSEAKQKLGAALQSTGLQDKVTPREALGAFGALYRSAAAPPALLQRFGLSAKADAAYDTLSGGQKQRLALALAFVNDPELVVLDEPTVGLDPQIRREVHSLIEEMRAEGRSVLLTTHDMEEAERLCDRIAVIDAGRIVAEGTPADLIARSRAAMSVRVQTSGPLEPEWLAAVPRLGEIAWEAQGARFATDDPTRAIAELTSALSRHGVELASLQVGRASLEEVILDLVGGGQRAG